ncbi:MAG: type III pantothenate kinase [Verrucomicrobia bacterium]|nr:type III pantothenate kinase [Verrucomicrobiota bacterium]
MDLVIDAKENRIFGAVFEDDEMVDAFSFAIPLSEDFIKRLEGKNFEKILIAGTNNAPVLKLLPLAQVLSTEKYPTLAPDQIANIYGALYHFPSNDCIIIDIADTLRCDYVSSQGKYVGGAIFSLSSYADRPSDMLADKQATGNYFGLLGAAERITAELRTLSSSPSSVMVIATGLRTTNEAFSDDLSDFVDAVDPYLGMRGLNEIIKEQ